ncbi:MAG: hypothetical protein ACM3QZ_14575 [Solirubrobacterales bacterium]
MEFRHAKKTEYPQVKAFFESFFGEDFYKMRPQFFNWLHADHPLHDRCAAPDEYTCFAAFDGDILVSCINYVPFDLYVDGIAYPSCRSVGWLSRSDYSGAVGGLLLRKNFRRFNYYMAMGDTEWVKTIYTTQFGFQYQHNIGRVVMVGSAERAIELLKRNPELDQTNFEPLHDWERRTYAAAQEGNYTRIAKIEDLNPAYWDDHLKRHRATVARDPQYIQWRYFNDPTLQYDIISNQASQETGIAIVRVETIRDSKDTVARLVDFMPTQGNEQVLAQAVASYLIDSKAVFLDFFCGSRENTAQWLPFPFIAEEKHLLYRFPRIFQPLEWRDRYSINASFGRNARMSCPLVDQEQTYFTKGDPLQDVQVNAGYYTRGF